MGEGIRDDSALALALQAVVADGGGRVQRFLDVAGLDDVTLLGVIGPDAGEAIGLELDPDRQRIGLALAEAALQAIPQSHISTTAFMSLRNVDRLLEQSDGRVWDVDTGHDLMITEPDAVAELLGRVAAVTAG